MRQRQEACSVMTGTTEASNVRDFNNCRSLGHGWMAMFISLYYTLMDHKNRFTPIPIPRSTLFPIFKCAHVVSSRFNVIMW